MYLCIYMYRVFMAMLLSVRKLAVGISESEANKHQCDVILKRWLLITSCVPSDGGDYFPLAGDGQPHGLHWGLWLYNDSVPN